MEKIIKKKKIYNNLLFLFVFCLFLDSTQNTTDMPSIGSVFQSVDSSQMIGLYASCVFFWALQICYLLFNSICFLRQKFGQPLEIFTYKGCCHQSFVIIKDLMTSIPTIWLQIPTFVLSLIFFVVSIVSTIKKECHSKLFWHLGVFAVIFAWANLIVMFSKLPVIGEYALIFTTICKTFLKLILSGSVLILASSFVLAIIFYNPQAPVSLENSLEIYYGSDWISCNIL